MSKVEGYGWVTLGQTVAVYHLDPNCRQSRRAPVRPRLRATVGDLRAAGLIPCGYCGGGGRRVVTFPRAA